MPTKRLRLIAPIIALLGCRDSVIPLDMSRPRDAAIARDLARPADLAPPAADLASTVDLATAPDGSAAVDLASPGTDAGPAADLAVDARMTAGDAGPVSCTSAGGTCVALTPTACPAPGVVGDATLYTCGGGLGVECCLPGTASMPPVCMKTGTADEGWYQPDGTLLCKVSCAGLATPQCQRIGSTAQGWYTTSGHGCPPYSTLIVHDMTCM
jgi:hypothetical protein